VQAVVNAFEAPGDIPGFESSFEALECEPSNVEQLIWCSEKRVLNHIQKSVFSFLDSDQGGALSDVCQSAVEKAKEALESDLLSASITTSKMETESLPPIWQVGGGWISLTLQFESGSGYLLIHPDVVSCHLSNKDAEVSEFDSTLVDVIRTERLSLQAKLCDISLRLSDIESLRPGDVIMSEVQVGDGVELSASDGTYLANGQLIENNGYKALQMVAVEK
jgi:flagellar motor switch/type III secretory pathway protein FliN